MLLVAGGSSLPPVVANSAKLAAVKPSRRAATTLQLPAPGTLMPLLSNSATPQLGTDETPAIQLLRGLVRRRTVPAAALSVWNQVRDIRDVNFLRQHRCHTKWPRISPESPCGGNQAHFRLWQPDFDPQSCVAGDRFIMVFVKIIEIQLDLLGPEL